jgi:hypothetical protein
MRVLPIVFISIAAAQTACTEVQEKLQRARASGNEASAIASLRMIVSSEMVYASSCANGGFAVSLPDLGKPPKGSGVSFLPADLAVGTTVSKSGYAITLSKDAGPNVTTTGAAAETCNGAANPPASSFFASAEPEKRPETGSRYFAVDARGTVYASSSPIANPIVPSATVTPLQ